MPIRKITKPKPFQEVPKSPIFDKLDKLAKNRKKQRELRDNYPEVFEEFDRLVKEETIVGEAVKALARQQFKITDNGEVISHGGVAIDAQIANMVDGNALVALNPKLLKVAKLRISINQDEVARLVAGGVLDEAHVKQCSSPQIRLSVKDVG